MPFQPSEPCTRGHVHRIFLQTHQRNCGIAVCAMVVNRKYPHTELSEAEVQKDYGTPSRDTEIVPLLEKFDIKAVLKQRLTQSQLKDYVRGATPQSPVIAAVTWEGQNTGHWILIEGRTGTGLNKSSAYCICDPMYGFVTTSLSKGKVSIQFQAGPAEWPGLVYSPRAGITGVLKGTVIKVS